MCFIAWKIRGTKNELVLVLNVQIHLCLGCAYVLGSWLAPVEEVNLVVGWHETIGLRVKLLFGCFLICVQVNQTPPYLVQFVFLSLGMDGK